MKTESKNITPSLAKSLLKGNTSNRAINMRTVACYARDMKNGDWKETHQGICLGNGGVLIDGQHRLLAIIAADTAVTLQVTVDERLMGPKDVPLDYGYKRSAAYILGIEQGLAAISSLAIQHAYNLTTPTPAQQAAVAALLADYYDLLRGDNKTMARGISSAAVQLAGVVRLATGDDSDYICTTYAALLRSRFAEMPPLPASFYRQVVVDRVAYPGRELFARAIRMFDHRKKSFPKLTIRDEVFAFEEARELLRTALNGVGK